MPFEIIEEDMFFKIKNIKKDKVVNIRFKTKAKAVNQAMNWMRYRGEEPILIGNLVCHDKGKCCLL